MDVNKFKKMPQTQEWIYDQIFDYYVWGTPENGMGIVNNGVAGFVVNIVFDSKVKESICYKTLSEAMLESIKEYNKLRGCFNNEFDLFCVD